MFTFFALNVWENFVACNFFFYFRNFKENLKVATGAIVRTVS